MINYIESSKNERVKQWMKLHQKKERDEVHQFLIEGEHLVGLALESSCVETLLLLDGYDHPFNKVANVILVSQDVLDKLSTNVSQVQMIAICNKIQQQPKILERVVLLDGIQDPGNMGAIIRNAVSFGFDQIVCSSNCVDLYNEKCIRSTQGAMFKVSIIRQTLLETMDHFHELGFKIFGTALKDAIELSQVHQPEKVAILFGNEGQGISPELLALTDQNIKIEMSQFESLNVAVASGICMYTFRKK